MKIALFTDTLCDANGVSRFLQDMGREAHERGHTLKLLTSTRKRRCDHLPAIYNAPPTLSLAMPFYPELDLVVPNRKCLESACLEFDPDIIHVSTPGPVGLLGRKIALRRGLPLVGTYHTDFPQYLWDNTGSKAIRAATVWSMKRFYKPFDHLLTRSTLYQKILHDRLGFGEERVTVLSAGTDTSHFHPDFERLFSWQDFNVPERGLKLLYVGRLTREKRFDSLLSLWEAFKTKTGSNAHFIVVGEGKYLPKVVAMKDLDVHYLGHMEKEALSFLYAASDLFISASITETLGQTILEAMASGTPVIVSEIGGQLDFVCEQCGAIVHSDTKEAWMDALESLMTNAKRRENAAQYALQRGQSMSITKSFDHFIAIHQNVKDNRRQHIDKH